MVAYNILRPLPSTTPITLPTTTTTTCTTTPTTTPPTTTTTTTTAKTLLHALSAHDIHLMHSYLTQRAALKYTPALVIPLWSAVFTLVPFLADPATHDVFARGCALLEVFERDMRGVRTFRRGILAVAWKIGVEIPVVAAEALEGLEGEVREGAVELRDVPVDFVIAVPGEVFERVMGEEEGGGSSGAGEGGRAVGLDLGRVLGEWGEWLKGEGR